MDLAVGDVGWSDRLSLFCPFLFFSADEAIHEFLGGGIDPFAHFLAIIIDVLPGKSAGFIACPLAWMVVAVPNRILLAHGGFVALGKDVGDVQGGVRRRDGLLDLPHRDGGGRHHGQIGRKRFGADHLYVAFQYFGGNRRAVALSAGRAACGFVVPDGFIQHDVTMIGADDGFIDIVGKVVLRPDKRLADALAGSDGIRGIMATGEQFIEKEEQKKAILSRFPEVIAADMECAAVMQVCERSGIPAACAKVISDGGSEGEYYEFKTKAADKAVAAVLGAIKKLCR